MYLKYHNIKIMQFDSVPLLMDSLSTDHMLKK